eukprot:RCo035845
MGGSVPSGLSRANPETTAIQTIHSNPQPEVDEDPSNEQGQNQVLLTFAAEPPERAPAFSSRKGSHGQSRCRSHRYHEAQPPMTGGALAETPSATCEGEDELLLAARPAAEMFRRPRASPPPSTAIGNRSSGSPLELSLSSPLGQSTVVLEEVPPRSPPRPTSAESTGSRIGSVAFQGLFSENQARLANVAKDLTDRKTV